MSADNILSQTAAIEGANKAILGIKQVHDEAPDALPTLPCSLRYLRRGNFSASRGLGRHNIHHFIVEVHLARARPGGLPEADKRARKLPERFQDLYANNLSLNGSCDVSGFEEENSWVYGALDWMGEETIGVRFYMWAKEMLDPITVNL